MRTNERLMTADELASELDVALGSVQPVMTKALAKRAADGRYQVFDEMLDSIREDIATAKEMVAMTRAGKQPDNCTQ